MSEFAKCITDLVKKDIASGLTPVEALENVGAKKLSGCDSIYYIAYGLYQDRVLFFEVPDQFVKAG